MSPQENLVTGRMLKKQFTMRRSKSSDKKYQYKGLETIKEDQCTEMKLITNKHALEENYMVPPPYIPEL